jgi:hypothetical protein
MAPRLARWSYLFGYGIWARIAVAPPMTPAALAASLVRSALFLAWAITGLLGIAALWAAVLMGATRLRTRPWLRGLVLLGLAGGLAAVVQFLVQPLAGLDVRRQPMLLSVLGGPVVVAVVEGWRVVRGR